MTKNKIAVKAFLGCLCCFVLIMGLNAADGTSGSGSTGSSGTANCTTVGETQEKYTADSNCGYSTQTRTCCSNKYWSGWDEPCPGSAQLVAERSTESLTLTCSGFLGAYILLEEECWGVLPEVSGVPYPKCAETNICDGKSAGYKCYESYSPTKEEMAARTVNDYYFPGGASKGSPDSGTGCHVRREYLDESLCRSYCAWYAGTSTGGESSQEEEEGGGTGAKTSNYPQGYYWMTGNSPFTLNVVTCKEQTSGGGTSTGGGTSGGGTQI